MIPTEKRGWGAAAARNKPTKVTPRLCISPQLAPPPTDARQKRIFAASEDYHDEGKQK